MYVQRQTNGMLLKGAGAPLSSTSGGKLLPPSPQLRGIATSNGNANTLLDENIPRVEGILVEGILKITMTPTLINSIAHDWQFNSYENLYVIKTVFHAFSKQFSVQM